MEKPTNWIVITVVLIVVLIAYFGYVITTKPSLSPDGDASVAGGENCGFGKGYFGGLVIDGKGEDSDFSVAKQKAVSNCEENKRKKVAEVDKNLAERRKECKDLKCIYYSSVEDNTGPCVVEVCSFTGNNQFCRYRIASNGELIVPGECSPTSSQSNGWSCKAYDGYYYGSATCKAENTGTSTTGSDAIGRE